MLQNANGDDISHTTAILLYEIPELFYLDIMYLPTEENLPKFSAKF